MEITLSCEYGGRSIDNVGKFSLLEEKDAEVDVQAKDFTEVTSRGRDCVVGKLVANRYVCKETIKNTLQCWWRATSMSFKAWGRTCNTPIITTLFIIQKSFHKNG